MSYDNTTEDLVYDVRDYFKANIKTYLDGVYALKNDGLVARGYEEYYIGERDPYSWTKLPVAMFVPDNVSFNQLTVGKDEVILRLQHIIVLGGDREENLTIMAMRHADAIRQLYIGDPSCGSTVDGIASEGEEYVSFEFYGEMPGQLSKKVIIATIRPFRVITR